MSRRAGVDAWIRKTILVHLGQGNLWNCGPRKPWRDWGAAQANVEPQAHRGWKKQTPGTGEDFLE